MRDYNVVVVSERAANEACAISTTVDRRFAYFDWYHIECLGHPPISHEKVWI